MTLLFIHNLFARRILSVFFTLTIISSTATPLFLAQPKEAEAQYASAIGSLIAETVAGWAQSAAEWAVKKVVDAAINANLDSLVTKEYILDGLAWFIAKGLIKPATNSVVKWINSGFNGEPNFVLDKSTLLGLVVDENTAYLIQQLAALTKDGRLGETMQKAAMRAIVAGFQEGFNLRPTFPGGWAAYDAYQRYGHLACLSRSSWDCYLSLSYWGNSPYGIASYVLRELQGRIAEKVANVTNDLLEGSGFLSLTECTKTNRRTDNEGNDKLDENGFVEKDCVEERRITPGTAVANQLHGYLRANLDSNIIADELEESIATILDALLNQLITQGVYALADNNDGNSFGYPPKDAGDRWCFTYKGVDEAVVPRPPPDPNNPNPPPPPPPPPPSPIRTVCQANKETCQRVQETKVTDPSATDVTSCKVEGSGPVEDAPPADTSTPSLTIIYPKEGEHVHDTITIRAQASDNDTVLRVIFYIDGVRKGFDLKPPYRYDWNTTEVPNGTHTIRVTVRDRAHNQSAASITVTVSNIPSSGLPQCSDNKRDNDNDSFADTTDPGCHTDGNANNASTYSPTDNNEVDDPQGTQCFDGVDNDGTEGADTADPQCHFGGVATAPWDASWDDENTPAPLAECSDGIDNDDGDTLKDREDPQCHTNGDLALPHISHWDDEGIPVGSL